MWPRSASPTYCGTRMTPWESWPARLEPTRCRASSAATSASAPMRRATAATNSRRGSAGQSTEGFASGMGCTLRSERDVGAADHRTAPVISDDGPGGIADAGRETPLDSRRAQSYPESRRAGGRGAVRPRCVDHHQEAPMNATDLAYTPALELGRLYRAKSLSPVEVTDAVLSRIEHLNPKLNAYLTVTADHARELARAAEARFQHGQPRGALDGIPYSIKDLEPTAGIRTTYGSKFFEHNVPTEDGAVASRLRASGGVLLGKTNTPHFGYKDMCDNLIGPPCKNPWNIARTSGASSGGAGSAVAAGLGPIAHGSDGSGSIRIPSALCGIFGLKPSLARVPYWPSADLWNARSHNGPMTPTVRDGARRPGPKAGPGPRGPRPH